MGDRLTRREVQCVRLAGSGLSNKEIGRDLKLAPNTVNNHLSNAYAKLGTNDRFQAAAFVAQDYPDYSRFLPMPISTPPPSSSGVNAPDEAVAIVGGEVSRTWPLPRPDRRIWIRLCWVLVFAACSAIAVTGIVSLMSAVVKDASVHAPPNAIRSLR